VPIHECTVPFFTYKIQYASFFYATAPSGPKPPQSRRF